MPPHIQFGVMPQLAEAISKEDDWTGTKDAAARRRAQTRLNARAYRRRKALAAADRTRTRLEALVECWDIQQQAVVIVPVSWIKQSYNSKYPLLPCQGSDEQLNTFFPLCPDHLIVVMQFNVYRALSANLNLVSDTQVTPMECNGEVMQVATPPAKPGGLPPCLMPTMIQQTVMHGDWIDVFPYPEARDRLILAQGTYDEEDLWNDCIGGLFDGFPDDEVERRGIIAWSPPWDVSGWEMSEGFLRKWGWLVKGVAGPIAATNRWRIQRGEEPFAVNDEYMLEEIT